jgi:ribosomal protein L13E
MSSSAKEPKPKGKKAAARSKAKPKVVKTKRPPKAVEPKEEVKPKKATPKPKKPVEKKEALKETVEKPAPVELGPPPSAMVSARHLDSMHERAARGFSFGELTSAGIAILAAKRGGLSVDVRRRTVREENVDLLKTWSKGEGPSSVKVAAHAGAKK